MKNFLFLLHLLLTAIPIGAQTVTYVSNGTIDCYAQGCQTATLNGDTMIFGGFRCEHLNRHPCYRKDSCRSPRTTRSKGATIRAR